VPSPDVAGNANQADRMARWNASCRFHQSAHLSEIHSPGFRAFDQLGVSVYPPLVMN
jgi:hypothetical protein